MFLFNKNCLGCNKEFSLKSHSEHVKKCENIKFEVTAQSVVKFIIDHVVENGYIYDKTRKQIGKLIEGKVFVYEEKSILKLNNRKNTFLKKKKKIENITDIYKIRFMKEENIEIHNLKINRFGVLQDEHEKKKN